MVSQSAILDGKETRVRFSKQAHDSGRAAAYDALFLCARSNLHWKALILQSACVLRQALCYECAAPLQLAAFGPLLTMTVPTNVEQHLRAEALPRCTFDVS
jgi:hypothetical protein